MSYNNLRNYIDSLINNGGSISSDRVADLERIAQSLKIQKINKLIFICTHNSRRSHLAQIWATVAASYFGFSKFEMYSGGTEVTALNERVVSTLENLGFKIEGQHCDNPRYLIKYADDGKFITAFSKKYDHFTNPQQNFAAIMTCNHADDNCPLVNGASFRYLLSYNDPKEADNSPNEREVYNSRSKEIGTEMFYLFSLLKS